MCSDYWVNTTAAERQPKSDFPKRQSPTAHALHNEVKLVEPVSNQHTQGAALWNDPTITVKLSDFTPINIFFLGFVKDNIYVHIMLMTLHKLKT